MFSELIKMTVLEGQGAPRAEGGQEGFGGLCGGGRGRRRGAQAAVAGGAQPATAQTLLLPLR